VADGIQLIAKEVLRQEIVEGFDVAHDATHIQSELLFAALSYAEAGVELPKLATDGRPLPRADWPFGKKWWKPTERIRNLIKAGAMLASEISRLRCVETTHRKLTPARAASLSQAKRRRGTAA
jgi:hypothetical protein